MSSWLDTQTKALLDASPPEKLAPPDTAGFSVVLLAVRTSDVARLAEAVRRVLAGSDVSVGIILAQPFPIVLRKGLSHPDALLAQFELVACDCVSVFLADDVAGHAPPEYLAELYGRLLKSPEFEEVVVRIETLPHDARAGDFLEKFLGHGNCPLPADLPMMRKKARIMQHWAAKIGGQLWIVEAGPTRGQGES